MFQDKSSVIKFLKLCFPWSTSIHIFWKIWWSNEKGTQCCMFTAAKKSSEAKKFVILICMTFAKQLQIDRMFTKMESRLLAFVNISRIWSYLCTLHFMPAYMMIGMGTAVDHGFHSILMALSKKNRCGRERWGMVLKITPIKWKEIQGITFF